MIYTKIINERRVFSSCATIQMQDGSWISNPTAEQIAEAGWEEYIPPVIPSEPELRPAEASIVSAVQKMLASDAANLSDEDALAVAALYPAWADQTDLSVGDRVWYDGKLFRVVQAHTRQDDWTPDATPALFTEVSIAEWPEWVQPTGAQDAYNTGDKVTYNGAHYESLIDGNIWAPDAYPAGWQQM